MCLEKNVIYNDAFSWVFYTSIILPLLPMETLSVCFPCSYIQSDIYQTLCRLKMCVAVLFSIQSPLKCSIQNVALGQSKFAFVWKPLEQQENF